jgi:selenoprotein W-related protein
MIARIQIHYCTQCRWMLRAAWMAQEILTTFEQDVAEVALVPGTGGVFRVVANEQVVWDRTVDEGFPQPKELKQRLRDVIAPGKSLGHSDR